MPNHPLSYDRLQGVLGSLDPGAAPNDNRRRLNQAKKLLRLGLDRELTSRQRACVELYYFQGLTQEQIARRLGVGKSTVCRHLQRSRERLKGVVRYAMLLTPPEE